MGLTRESNFQLWLLAKNRASKKPLPIANHHKTHCPHGHPYSKENTHFSYVRRGRIHRQCRACWREKARITRARDGAGTGHHNSKKTHCPQGHPYSGENLHIDKKTNKRRCKLCNKLSKCS